LSFRSAALFVIPQRSGGIRFFLRDLCGLSFAPFAFFPCRCPFLPLFVFAVILERSEGPRSTQTTPTSQPFPTEKSSPPKPPVNPLK
jgi:hypothetical protein